MNRNISPECVSVGGYMHIVVNQSNLTYDQVPNATSCVKTHWQVRSFSSFERLYILLTFRI
jgi:hypothetical protein